MTGEEKVPEFYVECAVCGQWLADWIGSTPCCGSIAYMVDPDGIVSDQVSLFASINNGPIEPVLLTIPKPTEQL